MAGIITEKEYNIHSFDVNYRYELLPTRLISFYQDIAMWQSEMIGIGNKFLTEKNLAWVIIRYNIKIYKYPKYMDTIKIHTYPVYNRRLYAYRKFKTFDSTGEIINEVDSAWMLLDSTNHKPRTMTDEMVKAYEYKDENDKKVTFENIEILTDCDIERRFKVRYSDIDSNKHVNNTVYISWAIETMPKESVINFELNNIEILFKKEALYEDEVIVKTKLYEKNNETIIAVHNIINQDGKILCLLRTKWRKK